MQKEMRAVPFFFLLHKKNNAQNKFSESVSGYAIDIADRGMTYGRMGR